MRWTTPDDIKRRLRRSWDKGKILGAWARDEKLYPLRLALRRPTSADLSSEFDAASRWMKDLDNSSHSVRGFGYELIWTEVNHRVLGRNRVPAGVVVPSEDDHLRLIGKRHDAERFRKLCVHTRQAFPELGDWLARKPLIALEHADEWPEVLAVVQWFRDHPNSGLFLRQLEIENIDSKFIERHRGLLAQLLEILLPPGAATTRGGGIRAFERRYGLLSKPALVRFRVLDDALRISGLSDLTVPVAEFADLDLRVTRVFVTENEVNGLAFPSVANSIVIFGLGYGLDVLSAVPCLKRAQIHYWGDIDTHGLAMLDRLRAEFPHTRSLLMGRNTLLAHRHLWVREEKPHRGHLTRLDADEEDLFEALQANRFGDRVRLEQERISYTLLKEVLTSMTGDENHRAGG